MPVGAYWGLVTRSIPRVQVGRSNTCGILNPLEPPNPEGLRFAETAAHWSVFIIPQVSDFSGQPNLTFVG